MTHIAPPAGTGIAPNQTLNPKGTTREHPPVEASATAASAKAPGARRLSRRPRPRRPLGASKASLGGGAALRRAERRADARSCTAATVPADRLI